ncbi:hypothetical protein GCL60_05115 [Silvanigrella paludirubra]|uniref:Lipoprotein n=1 Tax=Silvanigrella paludirubra TaxID=2499159 RepID=A0A6N6VXT0_9BACT|nr:hypothetical protein [Silvanigrella paludirubra]KAB8039642.1 hypothetical protein GCL60_05115 [Silvanigrella paludirubra]
MNKIFSIAFVSLLSLSSIALTSCGHTGQNTPSSDQSNTTPASVIQTKLNVKNFYSVSQYSSNNILNDKTVKWELNTTINCDGNPKGTIEIINQDSDPNFLLDTGKKCNISLNTFKLNDVVYIPENNLFIMNADEKLNVTSQENIQYNSETTTIDGTDHLYFNGLTTEPNSLTIAFSTLSNQLNNDSLIPEIYNLEYKGDNKSVNINSNLSIKNNTSYAFTLPNSSLSDDHKTSWGYWDNPKITAIKASVTDVKTNKIYEITLNAFNFAENGENTKLNRAMVYSTSDPSKTDYTNQFSISYDPTENKDLPNDAKLTGTLVINSLGWHIPSFKNINVHISIDNSAPTP